MTPTPPSSNSHSPPEQHMSNSAYRVVRKRNRVPLSCGPCRSRKLKCNRSSPCENCVRRNDVPGCTYATSTHSARQRKQSAGSNGSSDEMQSRIDRLEGLVLSLMSGNSNNINTSPRNRDTRSSSSGAAASYPNSRDSEGDDDAMGYDEQDEHEETHTVEEEVEEVRNALGVMKVQEGKSFYRGETHWVAILSEITEVKKYFEETKQKYESELATMRCQTAIEKLQATGFPFSAGRPPSKPEILALVPEQAMVDRLVDCFFRNHDPLFHVLHRPSFYKQYEEFWRDPSKVDILWLGLLMVIISISVKIHDSIGEPLKGVVGRDTAETWHAFRTSAEQCLIVGEYTKKPYLHTVQTLILLCMSSTDDSAWLFLGMVVRIAMSMGLHRDPQQFPAITPGEGEIRRRLWTQITCMELLTSIRIGLPSMLKEDECDTKLPLNLHDDEIGEDVTTLPPERGRDELTGVIYMICKASMAHTLWEVIRQVNSVKARPPYETVWTLEADINARYEQVPKFLHLKPIAETENDPPWLIIQRYNLDILRQMSLLTLHRPYATKARLNARFEHSYHQTIGAAMTLLRYQDEIATQNETVLRHARWYTETQGVQEFLHAAMIISLHLSCPLAAVLVDEEDRKRKFAALCRSRDISTNQKDKSVEANKASGIITVMIEKLKREEPGHEERLRRQAEQQQQQQQQKQPNHSEQHLTAFESGLANFNAAPPIPGPNFSATSSTQPFSGSSEPLKSEQAAALTLGMMSGGGLTPNSAFASLFDRPAVSTPGGTLNLPDAVNSSLPTTTLGDLPPPSGGALSPPGWNSLWGPAGFDMPQGSEWEDWENFMRGIDLDTSQLGGFPVLAGIGMYPPSAAQDRLDKKYQDGDVSGGGAGAGGGGGL